MITIISMILCIVSLCIGITIGYKLKPDKESEKKVEIKTMTPIEKVKTRRERKEFEETVRKEMDKYQTILDNINNYDGSSNNQKEIK